MDAWRQVNRLYLYLCSPKARRRFLASPSSFYTTIKDSCILFDGLIQNTLPRDEVYHFLQLGRFLERVNVMGRILHAKCRTSLGPDRRPARPAWSSSAGRACCGAARPTGPISAASATASSRSASSASWSSTPTSPAPSGSAWPAAASRSRRSSAATTTRSPARPSGCSAGSRASSATSTSARSSNAGLLPFLDGIQTICRRVAQEIQRTFFLV